MKKIVILSVFSFFSFTGFAQDTFAKLVTTANDTLNVKIKANQIFKSEFIFAIQEKIVVLNNDGTKTEYYPHQIKSFKVRYGDKMMEYESVDNKVFAELMYSNRLKLLRFIKPGYTSIHYYLIKKPNDGKTIYMEAMGLSRLISTKTVLREITDCPETARKIESDELKVKGEEGVINLVKDYEANCF